MVTITFFPNDRKKSVKTGRTPVYVRVRKDKKKAEGTTDWSLTPTEREKWNETIGRVGIKNSKANEFLNRIEDRFNEFRIFKANELDDHSPAYIRDHILGRNKRKKEVQTVKEYIRQYYEQNVQNSSRFSEGTKKNYRKAVRHMERFLTLEKLVLLNCSRLDQKFANRFSSYLMNDIPVIGKEGMSEVSACGIIKKFRTIFDQAVDEGLLNSNPFKKVKLSYRSPEKPKLTLEQFKRFLHAGNLNKSEMQYSQLFVFMSLTGMAFLDCQQLTLDHLEQTPHGIKLRYKRNKTGHTSEQYITSKVIELIDLFDKRPDVQNSRYLVPQVSNQQFNRTLKVIGAKFSIPFNVTTHHGRHTYRSLLDEANIVDPTVIKRLMGWSNGNSMDGIYRQVTDSRLFKTKEELEKLVSKL